MNPPPQLPEKTDERDKLVDFAHRCVRDLVNHLASIGEDPKAFPRSPAALEKVVNHRYPGLITNIREQSGLSQAATDLVLGLTYPAKSGKMVHGRRSGPIVLLAPRNDPRMRIVLAQELFQRVLDIPEIGTGDVKGLIDGMYRYRLAPNWAEAQLPVVLEYLSEIAALEYYFPHAHRETLISKIASEYLVPQNHTCRYLSVGYMEYFSQFQSDE